MENPVGSMTRFGTVLLGIVLLMVVRPVSADTIYQGTGSDYVAFEAEWADAISDDVDPPGTTWLEKTLAGASGGVALGADASWTIQNETATYNLMFDSAGTYELYMRYGVYNTAWNAAGDGSNDSFFRSTDFNITVPDESVPMGLAYPFDWYDVGSYTVSTGQVGTLQTFAIGTREPGFTADRLVFSKTTGLTSGQLDALANSDLGENPIPEPATLTLVGLGVLAFLRRRRDG